MAVSQRRKGFFDYFPAPEFMLLSHAGIAITDEGVKFAELRRGMMGGGLKVAHVDRIESAETASALKELVQRYNLSYARAILPDEKAYLFTAAVPAVPLDGLRDAVSFIVEENAPLALSEAVFDFNIIAQDDPSVIKVAVSALPKKVINAYIELLEGAGIIPTSFDIESQAIARAIIPVGDSRTTLIVNLGLKKTGFYVVEDGTVGFSTTLSGDLSDESASSYDLKSELRKVVAFWNARTDKQGRPQKKIERVLICGSGAGDQNRVGTLMAESPVEHSLANAWINTDSSPDHESYDYASVIGLALPRSSKSYV